MPKAKSISDKTSEQTLNFENALNELNQIVEQMEHGNLTLEQSLQNFERGVNLTRTCQTALKNAEQKVQILLAQNNQCSLTDFDTNLDSEA